MVDDVFTVRIPGHPALDFPWWGCLLLALAGLGFVAYVGMVMNTFFPRMCACRPRKKKLHGKGPATDVLYEDEDKVQQMSAETAIEILDRTAFEYLRTTSGLDISPREANDFFLDAMDLKKKPVGEDPAVVRDPISPFKALEDAWRGGLAMPEPRVAHASKTIAEKMDRFKEKWHVKGGKRGEGGEDRGRRAPGGNDLEVEDLEDLEDEGGGSGGGGKK